VKKKNFLIAFVAFLAIIGLGIFQNPTTASAVTIGLPQPEQGWQRIDDSDTNLVYIGKWKQSIQNTLDYGGNLHYAIDTNDSIKFNFYGTKLRLITNPVPSRPAKISIKIDGQEEFYSDFISSGEIRQAVSYEKIGLENKVHIVEISCETGNWTLDAIDIDKDGYLVPNVDATGITLNKTADTLTLGQESTKTDTLVATITPSNATTKNIKWESSDKSVATVDSTGKITAIKAGTAVITATTDDGTNLSASCTVTVNEATNKVILNIEPERDKIHLNETVLADVTIDNITNIAAEDIRITYDSSKLKFIGAQDVEGIKIVKSDSATTGELRVIVASKGVNNIVNAKKILLKLNFKGIATGEALVDVTKGRVSDGITTEQDLTDEQCGQGTITIEGIADVNNSGEYTLLDLAIDARHYGEAPSTLSQYNTDQVVNNAIDDADLTQIAQYMLANANYKPNNN
jgi:hypothetical protein